MQAKKWLFGDLFLQFDKSSTVRIPFSKQVNSNDERQEPKRYKRRISEEDVIEIHDTIVRVPEIKQEPNENNTINFNKQSSTGQAMEMERKKFEEDLEKISQQKAFNIKVFERNHQTMIELDEREAKLKQKEIELDEREMKLKIEGTKLETRLEELEQIKRDIGVMELEIEINKMQIEKSTLEKKIENYEKLKQQQKEQAVNIEKIEKKL